MLLHTLECIVNVEDGCCASIALNMHQMGYFTLLRIFILELFLTRENMRRRRRRKNKNNNNNNTKMDTFFIVTGFGHVKCY